MKNRKSASWYLIIAEALVLVLVVVVVIVRLFQPPQETGEWSAPELQQNEDIEIPAETEEEPTEDAQTQDEIVTEEFPEDIENKIQSMTLEEKVAQMFFISPEALTNADVVNVAGRTTEARINEYPVGGLVYGRDNFQGKGQASQMLGRTQEISMERIGLVMFLAVEETGEEDISLLTYTDEVNMVVLPDEFGGDIVEYEEDGILPMIGGSQKESKLILSDSISAEDAVEAIQNGADMLYKPQDFEAAYQAVLDAVAQEKLSTDTIDRAVARILVQKAELQQTGEENTGDNEE